MRLAAAQTRPIKGDIQGNIVNHIRLIIQAIESGAELVIFPELSLTGYEPSLAKQLAINLQDPRLNAFQEMSDAKSITIGVGAPTKNEGGGLHQPALISAGKRTYCLFKGISPR